MVRIRITVNCQTGKRPNPRECEDDRRRRQGVGDALVQSLCAGAKVAGAQDMFLEVAADNAAACALYAKHGFAQVGRRPAYYAGTDALVLRRAM